MDGIARGAVLPEAADFNLFRADAEALKRLQKLPGSIEEARELASESRFIREFIPGPVLDIYCGKI